MSSYDHTQPTSYTLEQCKAVIGEPARLELTGRVVDARESDAGPFVLFEVDERFGFGELRFGLDLELLTGRRSTRTTS